MFDCTEFYGKEGGRHSAVVSLVVLGVMVSSEEQCLSCLCLLLALFFSKIPAHGIHARGRDGVEKDN